MADGMHDVARARLPFRSDHRRALADAPEGLSEIPAATHEGNRELVPIDAVGLVGGSQDLRLVDEVDLERLGNSRLRNVADPALGHHGDRDGVLNFADLAYGRHPGDS